MKDKTYYEVLDVPANASPADIRAAFRLFQSIYDDDSLSTYSLFSNSERKAILIQVEEAFLTLSDADQRAAYDRELMALGRLSEARSYANKPRSTAPVFRSGAAGDNARAMSRIKEKVDRDAIRELKAGLTTSEQISGARLKALRRAAGIPLGDIFEASRVSVSTLEAIEAEDRENLPAKVYLKGFLKSYAECLGLDPEVVVTGFLDRLPT